MRALALTLTTAFAALALIGPATADARFRCDRVKGPFVAKKGGLRIFKTTRGENRVYRACITKSTASHAFHTAVPGETLKINRMQGRAFTFTTRRGTVTKRHFRSIWPYDLNGDNADVFWEHDAAIDCATDVRASQPPPARTFFIRDHLAVLYRSNPAAPDADCYPNAGESVLLFFTTAFNGVRPLDVAPVADLPVASITVRGRVLRWRSGGEQRSYTDS